MASIVARILGDGKDFNKTVAGVQGKVKGLKKAFAAFSVVLGGARLISWANALVGIGSRLHNTASKLGIATDFLQEWNFMAQRAGLATTTGEMALQRFTRRVGDAQKGFGEFLPVAKLYNIALFDSAGKARSAEEVFLDLSDVISGMSNAGEKVSTTFKAMDSEGVGMVNTLDLGREGIEELRKQAHGLGQVMSEDAISRLNKYSDGISDIGGAAKVASGELLSMFGSGVESGIGFYIDKVGALHNKVADFDKFLRSSVGIGAAGGARDKTAEKHRVAGEELLAVIREQLEVESKLSDEELASLATKERILEANEKIRDMVAESADTMLAKSLPLAEKMLFLKRKHAEQAAIVADEEKPSEERLAAAKSMVDLMQKIDQSSEDASAAKLAELNTYFDLLDASLDVAREEAARTAGLKAQRGELEGQVEAIKKQSAEWLKVGRFASTFQDFASGEVGFGSDQRLARRIQDRIERIRQIDARGGGKTSYRARELRFLEQDENKMLLRTGVNSLNPHKAALQASEQKLDKLIARVEEL